MAPPVAPPSSRGIISALISPLGIVVLYALVGSAWIFGSDQLLEGLFDQSAAITGYQTAKGLGYVIVTAALLFLGIQAGQRRLRRAAGDLARAESDQRTLLAEASDAIFVIDAQGLVTLANRKACELLGRPEHELVGGNIEQVLAPIEPARLQEATAIMAERGAFIEEHSITRPDQSQVQAEFHFSRLSDGRIQAIARDITERRRLESQLLQAQKMEVVGRMAGGVAHDFNNLLTIILGTAANARDAMPAGGTITLRTALERSSNGHAPSVVVAVRDTGTGMDAATRDRIFEPFFTTKPEGKGTGLGLPMVQEFASRSGGRVTVDSAVGRGTTVSVWLPVNGGTAGAH